ncbi:hypothetical protein [Mucilaginibacter ginsenosidivorax]|uniref:Uncharacterized protein n=1 Tax=Mucilaginibacter ginsenosidivorax TaxID=862126 RepID=A0A5B8VY16_9SPHI|nr:hypothetical protein [Mucilaginibacter ginsenosidivorax]QEC75832.1 hypothetical protein FSB76_07650 [Mucilaginibacter ginsenosidivorax]
MREFFINGLHVFVIVVISGFVILGNMALSGKFDHWDSRFIKKAQHMFNRLRRYFDRKHSRQQDENINARREHHAHHETHTNDDQTIE